MTSPSCSSPAALIRSPDPSGRWRADTRPSQERQRMVSVGGRRAAPGRGDGGGQYLGVRAQPPRAIPPDGVLSGTILAPLVLPFFAIA